MNQKIKKDDSVVDDKLSTTGEAKIEREPPPKLSKNFFLFLAFIFGVTVLIAGAAVVLDLILYKGLR